jgi:multiple sugar transport system permease protein
MKLLAKDYWTSNRQFAVLTVLPAVVVLLLITVFPTIYSITVSLKSYYLPRPYASESVGVDNYIEVLMDGRFWTSMRQTVILMASAISMELILGFGIALFLYNEFKGSKIITPIILMPMMIAPVIVGYMWRLLFQVETGPINYLLGFLSLGPYAWTSNVATAVPSIVIADIWQWTPFVVLVLLAGLTSLSPDILEAAQVDGASGWQKLIYVIIPMLRRVVAIVLLLRILDTFRMFDKIYVMTHGGPGSATETVGFYAYLSGFKYLRIGYAAAMSFLLLFITVIMSMTIAKTIHGER